MSLKTSITVVLPLDVQSIAVPLLRQYTYDFPRRLPAHLTVCYPFVPPEALAAGTERLRALMAEVAPFEVTLQGYGSFPLVSYLDVVPSPPLTALIKRIYAAFPGLVSYDGEHGDAEPVPHVAVGVFRSKRKQSLAQLPDYEPQTFTIDRLTVGLGDEDRIIPWIIRDVVHLGG